MIHELRIYTAHPGKMDTLLARFRDHTTEIFEKHGITNIGYWLNSIGGRNDQLWYIIGFDDLAQRDVAWASFKADRLWQDVKLASEANGPIVALIENRIMEPTDFSPLR